jgi:hypothetical protein
MVLATRRGVPFTNGQAAGAGTRAALLAAVGLLAASLGACGDRPPPEAGGEAAAKVAGATSAPAEAFVVFTSSSLTIDRLEVPVPVPATVGSTPSPLTLSSDAPEVVSVDASGALVGHNPSGRLSLSEHCTTLPSL